MLLASKSGIIQTFAEEGRRLNPRVRRRKMVAIRVRSCIVLKDMRDHIRHRPIGKDIQVRLRRRQGCEDIWCQEVRDQANTDLCICDAT